MTVLAYNVGLLAVVAGCLGVLGRYLQLHGLDDGRDALLTFAMPGILVIASLLGILFYRGNQFGIAQLLAWSTFVHAPVFLIGLGFLYRKQRPAVATGALAFALCLGLIAVDAFLIEPRWLDVTYVELGSAKLSESVRVVILADVQTDRPGPYEMRVLQNAMAQKPDLILFAGDYIHLGRRSRSYQAEMDALNAMLVDVDLHAPLGVYAVAGNVDRSARWVEIFDGVQAITIEDTSRYDLGPLVVTGLSLVDAFGTDVALPAEEKFHIVLGHSPNFSLAAVGGDLLIAGHTHGGQVQLPFIGPLLTLSAVPRDWASGITEIGWDRWLIVSRGIGMERASAPRLRFLCRPEMIVVDLVSG